jgi:hypothetical protein
VVVQVVYRTQLKQVVQVEVQVLLEMQLQILVVVENLMVILQLLVRQA